MSVETQDGKSYSLKFAPYQLKYIRSRIEAVLEKEEAAAKQAAANLSR